MVITLTQTAGTKVSNPSPVARRLSRLLARATKIFGIALDIEYIASEDNSFSDSLRQDVVRNNALDIYMEKLPDNSSARSCLQIPSSTTQVRLLHFQPSDVSVIAHQIVSITDRYLATPAKRRQRRTNDSRVEHFIRFLKKLDVDSFLTGVSL